MSTSSDKSAEIVETCRHFGSDSIVLLSGVAGTGKTHVARIAAEELSGHPAFVRQVQFHQSFAYEDFMEGLRPTDVGGFEAMPGVFLEWNQLAGADPDNVYVLLIEEFSRAPVSSVLGELMTYIEHRNRDFVLPISRESVRVASNLVLLATMNPRDRSALEIDDALIRRLRIIDCPPSNEQLEEMLDQSLDDPGSSASRSIVTSLTGLFDACRNEHPETFDVEMPFGHGMFAGVRNEADLRQLWNQRIKHLLKRPLMLPHPFYGVIADHYPWRNGGSVITVPETEPEESSNASVVEDSGDTSIDK